MTLPMNIILYIFRCFVDQTGIRLDVFAKYKKTLYKYQARNNHIETMWKTTITQRKMNIELDSGD